MSWNASAASDRNFGGMFFSALSINPVITDTGRLVHGGIECRELDKVGQGSWLPFSKVE